MIIDNRFKDKKVLILGLGVNQGGVGAAKFFAQAGAKVRVTDLKRRQDLTTPVKELEDFQHENNLPKFQYKLGWNREADIKWADLIIRNPAVKPGNFFLRSAVRQQKQVEMDLGVFFQFVNPKQVLGVTGTKGKSTTSSLIYEVLKRGGKNVLFAGNIGKSMLDAIPLVEESSFVILELSSFHLQACEQRKISPKYSVITNIYPDHLNYHQSMEEYIAAKRSIALYQPPDGVVFLRKDDPVTSRQKFIDGLPGQVKFFSKDDLPGDFDPILPGEHNKNNFAAALTVARYFEIDEKVAIEAMENFQGVAMRLQLIKDFKGIKIYNDSAATNPESTVQALLSLPNSILIAGGVDKGLMFEKLAETIDEQAKSVYFLAGDASEKIQELMLQKDKIKGTFDNLEKLVKAVQEEARSGDIILFSPGAASFNMFQNEFDRGRKFNRAIDQTLS